MNSPYAPVLEKTLVAIIALIFFSPLFLTVVTYNVEQTPSWAQWLNHDWLRNRTLRGVRIDPPVVSFSWPALRHAQYQHSVASRFDVNFAGRELLIRLTNELHYRLFRTSTIRIDPLALGQDDWLFEKKYLREYSFQRYSKAELEPMVEILGKFQEECRKRKIPFAILITPSKASIYEEKIPAVWKRRYDPRPRVYPLFKQLLDEHRIDYVDGVDLTARAKANALVPVFPRGGIHWSNYGCLPSANKLLSFLRAQGLNILPLEVRSLSISDNPQGHDADIHSIMNLLIPWHYKVGQLRIKPMPEKAPRPNLVIMGDSFMWQLASQISASAQCGEIATYFYAKLRKTTYVDGKAARAIDRLFKVDFGSEIFAADALVYEVNEGNIAPSDARITFVTEALEYAAHSPSKRVPFLSERARPYWWGEKIAFRHYDPNVRAGFLDGFLDPQPPVVWTAGREAAIELAGSPPTRDLILEAEVGAVIPKPGYEQTVTLLANGERVAQWSIPTLERTKRRAMIPRQLVADGKLTLRLQLAVPPGGLQSAGAIPAPAVCFYGLQIFSGTGIAGQLPGPDDFKPYQLGEEISFQKGSSNVIPAKFASGFSANEAHGTWTDGTESEIRLRVPSSDRDLVLTAYLGGYFPPDKSEQLTAVYVNGEPVGQWSVTFTTPTKRRLVIPRACVGKNGEIDLQFQIAYPVSPFEAGQGADPRKLGLLFTQLDIRAGPKN